ncbi:hypothetical protein [Atopobium sp. oral taxon 416]|uniref:hypothetical protein n=1 Tax=Atopobium sp. oral taxon 416 TaxID=712157 RepID=UPI001BA7AF3B|nr:hypothetical protein [Atopobium sp. oral taxon 416]QUC04589.1 hypothetical protein J4859_06615 [Atopobium sp. oral taxon 416]
MAERVGTVTAFNTLLKRRAVQSLIDQIDANPVTGSSEARIPISAISGSAGFESQSTES